MEAGQIYITLTTIHIRNKVKSWIRIRIEVKSWIQIRIKVDAVPP
jgi:hypothetical protein